MVRPRGRQRRNIRSSRDQRLMLRAVDQAFGNFSRAREIYRQMMMEQSRRRQLPIGSIPDRREFQRLEERFTDALRYEFSMGHHRSAGRPRTHWRVEERIIALARSFPAMGLRRIARRVGVSHVTVLRIIREEGLRPYRVQLVQALQPQDIVLRRQFCRWMLRKLREDRSFLKRIVFTDEATFSSTSMLNRHNIRIWARRNPHAIVERTMQGRVAVNVWAGIFSNTIIGPEFLHPRMNSTDYLELLRGRVIPRLREQVPRESRNRVYFMHDGAPPHFGLQVRQFLQNAFGTRWIGRRPAPHIWPPRSPDLNPLDFFFWGALKDYVYGPGRSLTSQREIENRVNEGVSHIMQNESVLRKVRLNLKERLKACLRRGGRHIEAGEQARLLRAIGVNGSLLWST